MAAEKSGESSLRMGQTPIEAVEDGTTVTDPTVNEKSIPPMATQSEEHVPPPAYSEGSGIPISEIPATSTPLSRPSHLRKPIAIPTIDGAFDSPFIRAYPPTLKDYMLPRESFFSFLDNLNQVIASSPPLQVLDAAGGILKSVPILFPLHLVGSAVSGIANLGSLGVSKGRTELAIRQANKEIFGPRGLRVEIAKLDALAYVAGIPILDARGKVNRLAPLLQLPISEATGISSPDPHQRWLQSLQPWIADLDLETLPSSGKSKLTRFNAALKKYHGHGQRQDDRDLYAQHQRLADERQRRLARAVEDRNRSMLELNGAEGKATSRGSGSETIVQNRSRIQSKYDQEVKRINEEYAAENPEDTGIRKILWLVIRDLEVDSSAAV